MDKFIRKISFEQWFSSIKLLYKEATHCLILEVTIVHVAE